MEINEIILSMRNFRNLTRKEMAYRTYTSVSYYQQIEKGIKKPRLKLLVKISNAQDVPIDLYFKDEEKIFLANSIISLLVSMPDEINSLIENLNLCKSTIQKSENNYGSYETD